MSLFPSLNRPTSVMHVALIVSFILRLYYEAHNIVCSTAHICNKQYAKMCSSNTPVKIKNQKLFRPPVAYSITSMYN